MESEAELAVFLSNFGGARENYDDDDLLYSVSLRTAKARARSFAGWTNIRGEPLTLACGFARARELNAVAGRVGTTHCAAVFEPLIGAFFDLFTALLSVPCFLADVGSSSLEDKDRLLQRKATLGFGFVAGAAEEDTSKQLDHMTIPRCPIRALTAMHMAHIAFDFIWSHELWHCAMGHVDYASTLNIRRIFERPGQSSDSWLLPLEEEADRLASYWIADQVFQKSTPYLPLALRPNPLQRLALVRLTLALTAFFWAHLQRVDQALSPDGDATEDSHPPPLLRMHLALRNADHFVSQRRGVSLRDLRVLDELLKNEFAGLADGVSWFRILHPDISHAPPAIREAQRFQDTLAQRYASMCTGVEFFSYALR